MPHDIMRVRWTITLSSFSFLFLFCISVFDSVSAEGEKVRTKDIEDAVKMAITGLVQKKKAQKKEIDKYNATHNASAANSFLHTKLQGPQAYEKSDNPKLIPSMGPKDLEMNFTASKNKTEENTDPESPLPTNRPPTAVTDKSSATEKSGETTAPSPGSDSAAAETSSDAEEETTPEHIATDEITTAASSDRTDRVSKDDLPKSTGSVSVPTVTTGHVDAKPSSPDIGSGDNGTNPRGKSEAASKPGILNVTQGGASGANVDAAKKQTGTTAGEAVTTPSETESNDPTKASDEHSPPANPVQPNKTALIKSTGATATKNPDKGTADNEVTSDQEASESIDAVTAMMTAAASQEPKAGSKDNKQKGEQNKKVGGQNGVDSAGETSGKTGGEQGKRDGDADSDNSKEGKTGDSENKSNKSKKNPDKEAFGERKKDEKSTNGKNKKSGSANDNGHANKSSDGESHTDKSDKPEKDKGPKYKSKAQGGDSTSKTNEANKKDGEKKDPPNAESENDNSSSDKEGKGKDGSQNADDKNVSEKPGEGNNQATTGASVPTTGATDKNEDESDDSNSESAETNSKSGNGGGPQGAMNTSGEASNKNAANKNSAHIPEQLGSQNGSGGNLANSVSDQGSNVTSGGPASKANANDTTQPTENRSDLVAEGIDFKKKQADRKKADAKGRKTRFNYFKVISKRLKRLGREFRNKFKMDLAEILALTREGEELEIKQMTKTGLTR